MVTVNFFWGKMTNKSTRNRLSNGAGQRNAAAEIIV